MIQRYETSEIHFVEMTTDDFFEKLIEYIKETQSNTFIEEITAILRLFKYSRNAKNIYFEIIKRKADKLALNLAQYSQVLFTNNTYSQTKLLKNIFGNNASESHN